ncbi:unnamed protein product [Polarella glacialis]|uniref:Uncharacterized protein n=1 Tax=Polarella glacialis TaxID=89957 RepID=A0A813FN14_POLGL|nr:unnamed protein product [Polarella glacialis]
MARGPTHSARLQPHKVMLLLAAWLEAWLVVPCQFALGPAVPLAFKVLSPWRFKEILDYRTVTAKTYKGLPLADFSEAVRGTIFKSFARQQDQKLNPGAAIQDANAGLCVNGRQRSRGMAEYNWLRDGVRVQFKSSQIQWNLDHWRVRFANVKLNREHPALSLFDELLVALYTPRGIYMYRHDLTLGVSTNGIMTNITGSDIVVSGPRGVTSWSGALDVILQKMDGSGCTCLGFFCLDDAMLKELAAERRQGSTQLAYKDLPLADCSCSTRGDCLHNVVQTVDAILNPARRMRKASRRGWMRGECSVKIKSAQLSWALRCWRIQFGAIGRSTALDELLLALYTPRGIYVYQHDLQLGISKAGVVTSSKGPDTQILGPQAVEDWQVALNTILGKLDANTNGCKRLAFIPFRRMEGWSSNELASAEPVQD